MKHRIRSPGALPAIVTGMFAVAMATLAMAGGYIHFSSIPYWDMWFGTLGFFLQLQDGDYSQWLAQHNEHRIFLARILFWADYKFFNGSNHFLIIANYLIVSVSCYMFWLFIRRICQEAHLKSCEVYPLWFFVTGLLWLWTQAGNLTWGFQSQFFLAQLLPLTAFYFLSKSVSNHSLIQFSVACCFGVLSAGTMANGVLAMPLMLVYSLITRQGPSRCLILLALAVAISTTYFHGYQTPDDHVSPVRTLTSDPVGQLHYMAIYLGSPAYHLLGGGAFGKIAAALAGAFLILMSAVIGLRQIRNKANSPAILALIVFIVYIVGTAFATAGGRLILGIDQALSFRYTTPALMAWTAVIACCWGDMNTYLQRARKPIIYTSMAAGIVLLSYQLNALENTHQIHANQRAAALALTLGVKDDAYIAHLHEKVDWLLALAEIARNRELSIFAMPPYAGLQNELNTVYKADHGAVCAGHLDQVQSMGAAENYVRVQGWIFDPKTRSTPSLVRFTNQENVVVGFALTGTRRKDVKKLVDPKAVTSGFTGYIKVPAAGSSITAISDNPDCKTTFVLPSIFTLSTPPRT